MDVTRRDNIRPKTKFFLVFFCCCVLACSEYEGISNLEIRFEGDRAVAVVFDTDQEPDAFSIALEGADSGILGDFESQGSQLTFTPAVPFGRGQCYRIKYKGKTLEKFRVKALGPTARPELVAIYPQADTVPENLLKMYFKFSMPM